MDDLLEEFIAETRETLEVLTSQLVEWEKHPQDRALLDSVFRFVHTVKGSCGFLELPRLLRLSHAAEDVLSSAREGNVTASPALVTDVLAVIDRIATLTEALESGAAVYDNDEMLTDAMLMHVRNRGHAAVDVDAQAANDIILVDPYFQEPSAASKTRTVRVSLALLDKLMNGVSDMVLARNEVSRQLRKAGTNNDVEQSFGRLSASVAEMRDAVGSMRMQNIDKLFSSLPRLVRDIAIELGKEIELRIDGSEVEVDREMVEALRDPLTHILRNAADHGIERADERRAAGKDPVGHIHIAARQSGNQIVIDIIDDGRGINVEKLGVRAVAAKAVTAADWQKMSTRAQLNTIFTPGLSTADVVTSISGRGVGMDVVRTNLQSIGGTIELENHDGRGLKMTLRLPLTLSIMAGLSVRAGGQIFGIARSSVVEMLSATNANVKLEELGGRKIACIRGRRYPFKSLEEVLGVDFVPQIAGESRTLIVMRPAVGKSFVLEVAAVIDHEELVVKPGAPLIMATGLFAGTSLPDNGKPMLLLDASGIAAALGLSHIDHDDHRDDRVAVTDTVRDGPSALLFIAMNGSKQALRLSAIDRMEDVDASAIRFVGGKMRVSLDDGLFDVWELDTVPVEGQVKLLKLSDGENCCYLAVRDVLDIFSITGEITPSSQPDLFEGIIRAFDEHVELRSMFALFETSDRRHRPRKTAPLCFIDCGEESQWERTILAPLLGASGYAVSFDRNDHARAAIVLHRDIAKARMAADDPRALHLRDTSNVVNQAVASIYRYDRLGLLSAIEDKLQSGTAA
jgi:two-component system chemotaxis sensor kinase CheA